MLGKSHRWKKHRYGYTCGIAHPHRVTTLSLAIYQMASSQKYATKWPSCTTFLGGNELVYTGVLHERRQSVSRGASQGNRAVVPNRYTSVRDPEARSYIVVVKFVKGWQPYRK